MGMPQTIEEKKASLVDQVAIRVHEKCPASLALPIEHFVREYYRRVGPADLVGRKLLDLYGAALAHWDLGQRRRPGERLVRVYNPRVEEHGWHSSHTIVEVVQDDMPFLVDSARMELNRLGLTVHLIIHPVVGVRREAHGQAADVVTEDEFAGGDAQPEAFMHFEVDRQTDPGILEAIRNGVERVLQDVQTAVEDWPAMRQRLAEAAASLSANPPPGARDELEEILAFLRWLDRDSFTFLGYREYSLESEGEEKQLRVVPGSGLGIAREPREAVLSGSFSRLPPELRDLAARPDPLILTKGSSKATVHRPGYLDYVGIRRFDGQGNVVGEARFLGRYTSVAYTSRPKEIPLLQRKVEQVMLWSGLRPGSHSAKALLNIIETLPRDELFQSTTEELFDTGTAILQLQERQQVRLIVRRDPYHRFLSCLAYLPRERFNTDVRLRIQEVLTEAFNATEIDFDVSISESMLARLYLTIHTGEGVLPEYRVADVEERIVEATRSWSDELHEALLQELGEEEGNRSYARYRRAFPASYSEDYPAPVAVHDVREIESLATASQLGILIYRPLEALPGRLRIKLFRRGRPISLSTVLPMLENMGVVVTDERPHEVTPSHRDPVWIHDLGMEFEPDGQLETEQIRYRFRDAFARVWDGEVENDGFNRLVLHAHLSWRQAAMLRGYCKYLLQTEFPFSQRYMEQVLVSQAQITRLLADLFRARFDPAGRETSAERCERLGDAILRSLEAVPNLDEDRILRRFYLLIQSTLRTNYFQRENGAEKPYISFKLDPRQFPDLPEPKPQFEIFLYSPRTEGVHLRGGKVARGGIRWSDRLEDFRTEIFGLMKAQMVKNAVIVPVGAKGGFTVKQPPAEGEALREEVVACYRTFIRGLLDLTDNVVAGRIRAPADTVRYDDDDPYLVVAADKGTAAFSDIANGIAADYGFWLGDAFASGGSTGYDHKKMGITARGAWESVRRHFRELGTDIQSTDFTVAGIGSMNGDVFGNGMLLSRHIRLVAAFSHQHIFLDPDPDPEASFAERRRLFELPGSWKEYDTALISTGGGVFSRSAKSIPLSPEVRRRLRVEAEALPPNELIRAILKAPVDLLWNGGIGTFVRASEEDNDAVGDRTNDPVRITARELRCRVVGEGGNLGMTQRARVEFARHGGRVNGDFIDNSGGVDCSDHEVNIKVLLRGPLEAGTLDTEERNRLLAQMTEEVARLVLRNNDQQSEALSMSEHHAGDLLPEHVAFLRALEKRGYLERRNWALPDDEAIELRHAAGEGLTRPELAVLLSYGKIALFDALVASGVSGDTNLAGELHEYFPAPLTERFTGEMHEHPLRPEIIATFIANNLINRLGITAAHRIEELSGREAPDIARAFIAARRIFDLPQLWDEISGLDCRIAADDQLAMLDDVRRLANRATLWLLRNRPQPLDVTATVETLQGGVGELSASITDLLDPGDRAHVERRREDLLERGVPEPTAARFAVLPLLFSALDISHLASAQNRPIARVGSLYFALGSALGIHWLRDHIAALPVDDHWARLAREALRDELFRIHRGLALEALEASPREQEAGAVLAEWIEANRSAVEHYQQRVEQFRATPSADFALLSVALSELRKLSAGANG